MVTVAVLLVVGWGMRGFLAPDFRRLLRSPDGKAAARAVVLHELGHLVGLNHVSDRGQIMFSESRPDVTRYGVGDLTGLSKLGQGPCFRS